MQQWTENTPPHARSSWPVMCGHTWQSHLTRLAGSYRHGLNYS